VRGARRATAKELSVTRSDPGAERQRDAAAEIIEVPSDDIFAVSVRVSENGTVTLVLVGQVDAFTAPLLRSSIADQLEGRPRELVLDLSAVDFLGSAGLAALVETLKSAADRDVALRLIATSRAVIRPLHSTGLIDLFTVTDTTT
jgi:anti-sigma B factor antagonist